VITLVLVPSLYLVVEDVKHLAQNWRLLVVAAARDPRDVPAPSRSHRPAVTEPPGVPVGAIPTVSSTR